MKASRFSDAQKAFILKQGAHGIPVADGGLGAGEIRHDRERRLHPHVGNGPAALVAIGAQVVKLEDI
jgi:hypothetical protein